MPCCLLLSKQTCTGTFPTMVISVLSIHMSWEMDWGEVQGLVSLGKAMQGADLGLVHTQRRKKTFLRSSTLTEVWTDLSSHWQLTWGSKEQVLPHSPPYTCLLHTCSPSGPLFPRLTPLGYLQGPRLGALGFLPQSATWEEATTCRPQPHTLCPALPPLVALCMAWTPIQVPWFLVPTVS